MREGKFTRADIQAAMTAAGADTDTARKLSAVIVDALAAALISGKVIELRGLGTLATKRYKPHIARNPKTGEAVNLPARRRVFFKAGRTLKTALYEKEKK